ALPISTVQKGCLKVKTYVHYPWYSFFCQDNYGSFSMSSSDSLGSGSRTAARGFRGRGQEEREVERCPEDQGESELPRQGEEVVEEAVGVAGEGAVVREAPGTELGGIDRLDREENKEYIENDSDQESPAQVPQPLPPGDVRHGEEEGEEEHQ